MSECEAFVLPDKTLPRFCPKALEGRSLRGLFLNLQWSRRRLAKACTLEPTNVQVSLKLKRRQRLSSRNSAKEGPRPRPAVAATLATPSLAGKGTNCEGGETAPLHACADTLTSTDGSSDSSASTESFSPQAILALGAGGLGIAGVVGTILYLWSSN